MFKLKNNTKRVICIEEKDIVPGTDGLEFEDEKLLEHPRLKKLVEAGDLTVIRPKPAKNEKGAGANTGGDSKEPNGESK